MKRQKVNPLRPQGKFAVEENVYADAFFAAIIELAAIQQEQVKVLHRKVLLQNLVNALEKQLK